MTGIRCDANSIIASGHMMRCLTIAKELVRQGEAVTIFLADEESKALFDAYVGDGAEYERYQQNVSSTDDALGDADGDSPISAVVLDSNWQDMEGELPKLTEEINNRKIKCLLVDSYKVTTKYFEELKKICPVAYMDDLGEGTYSVDMLINYSGYYETLRYEESYKEAKGYRDLPTALLLGLNYAPLREQFYRPDDRADEVGKKTTGAEAKEELNEATGLSVLLTSGGADTKSMLLSTLIQAEKTGLLGGSSDRKNPESDPDASGNVAITWHVVVGSLVKDDGKISEFAKKHPEVAIHRAVKDMAGLMRKCDVAICAAGTMLTECAAIELPAIFYQVADNQKYNVEFWGKTGGMIFAGDATDKTIDVTGNICCQLKALLHEKKLPEMRKSLFGITDGRGAERIAKALLEL